MLEFASKLFDFLNLIGNLIWNVISGFLRAVSLTIAYIPALISWIGLLPSVVIGFIITTIMVSVIFFMIGRT